MAKLTKTVYVNEAVRDLVQRCWLEYYQKERVLKGLIDDHQYDADPTVFLESTIFKAYEKKASAALLAYETAGEEMEKNYKPEEFKNIENYQWTLDYESCALTYTAM